jgi:hypothetical protein
MSAAPSRPLHLLCALLLAAVSACSDSTAGPGPGPDPSITLSPTALTLLLGETKLLTASVANAGGATVVWRSDNAGVAGVDAQGNVTGVASGSTTVHASLSANPQVSASSAVTVSAVAMTVTPAVPALSLGDTVRLVAAITGAVNTAATFSSQDTTVARVDAAGLVTAVGAGTAVIVARAAADAAVTANTSITVNPGVATLELRRPDGSAVNPDSVAGTVTLAAELSLPAGFTGTLEVLFNDEVVSTQPLSVSAERGVRAGMAGGGPRIESVTPAVVTQVTAEQIAALPAGASILDITKRNGPATLGLAVRDGAGIRTNVRGLNVNLRNQDVIALDYGFTKTATNPLTNEIFQGGDLHIEAISLAYSGALVAQADFGLGTQNAISGVVNLVGGRGRLTVPIDLAPPAGVLGLEGSFDWRINSSALLNGSPGPTQLANEITALYPGFRSLRVNIDYRGPDFTGYDAPITTDTYVPAGYRFNPSQILLNGQTVPDLGSGLDESAFRLQLGLSYSSMTYSFAADEDVSGSFQESTPQWVARLEARDFMGNPSSFDLGLNARVGFDLRSPVGGFLDGGGAAADRAFLGNSSYFGAAYTDPGISSGFDPGTGIKWRLEAFRPNGLASDACLLAALKDGACPWSRLGPQLSYPFADLSDGVYFRASTMGIDAAGNRSPVSERWGVYDVVPPTGTAQLPDAFTGGESFNIPYSVQDNLHLAQVLGGFRYGTGTSGAWIVPYVYDISDPPFTSGFRLQFTAEFGGTFRRSLAFGNGPSFGVTRNALSYFVGGSDVAGNTGGGTYSLAGRFTPNPLSPSQAGYVYAGGFCDTDQISQSNGLRYARIVAELGWNTMIQTTTPLTSVQVLRLRADQNGTPQLLMGTPVWTPVPAQFRFLGAFNFDANQFNRFEALLDAAELERGQAEFRMLFNTSSGDSFFTNAFSIRVTF